LQWRLQYSRVIERAGQEEGVVVVYRAIGWSKLPLRAKWSMAIFRLH
jgi:hypothetical protein